VQRWITEHQSEKDAVTATGLITVTIPTNIYTAAPGSARRWGLYTLKNGTGSVRFIPDAGTTGLQPAILQGFALAPKRFDNNLGTVADQVVSAVIAVPAGFTGRLLMIYDAAYNNTVPVPSFAMTYSVTGVSPPALGFVQLKAMPTAGTAFNVPDYAIYEAPLSSFPAATITVTVTGGPRMYSGMIGLYLIAQVNPAGTTRLITHSNVSAGNAVTQALTALTGTSLVIVQSRQPGVSITGPTAGTFQSFSTNIGALLTGTSTGIQETAVPEGNAAKNFAFGIGSSTPTATGDFVAAANYTSLNGRAGIALVAYPPTTVAGAGAVTLNKEDGRDTLIAPYGSAELWFDPDGLTVRCRMSRHVTEAP